MLAQLKTQEAYYAIEALWYNAYHSMPPKGVSNIQLINNMVADKKKGYSLKHIISYIIPSN